MTPERWQQVKELFHSALERESNHRALFLDEACAGDVLLRREVESLITSHEQTGSFIDSPAYELGAELLTEEQAETLVGQRIAHYQIVALLGSGGMGEVYLAQDTRLGREIALKLLPAQFTTDKDRLRRFEQEAHAASTLSHPNVCVIYEVGETEDDRHYIAMEYVDGVTLRQHMTDARLKLSEVLDVAAQVASGLAAAHEVGIVHRDVKPENIMLRRDGYIKVLDFGLAKLTEQPTTAVTTAAQARVKTDTGLVMGTSGYMSPEQARGLSVDARTDIWSLGVVLYEMIAGCAPFVGATDSDVMVSILEREPLSLTRNLPEVPPDLQRIVSKALRKDREERYQGIREMVLDLRSLRQELEFAALRKDKDERYHQETVADPRDVKPAAASESRIGTEGERAVPGSLLVGKLLGERSERANRLIRFAQGRFARWLIAPAIVGLILAVVLILQWRSPPPPRIVSTIQLTNDGRDKSQLATDGSRLYFSEASWPTAGFAQVSTSGGEATLIPAPFLEGPGQGILYDISRGRNELLVGSGAAPNEEPALWVMSVLGGPGRRLGDLRGHSACWSPDNQRVAYANGRDLYIAKSDGTESRKLAAPPVDGFPIFPAWSPDGSRLRFNMVHFDNNTASLWEEAVDGTDLHPLFPGWKSIQWGGRWTPDGRYYIFLVGSDLRGGYGADIWAIRETKSFFGKVDREPIQLTFGPLGFFPPVFSPDGKRLFTMGYLPHGELVRYDVPTEHWVPFLSGISASDVDFSRDGKWVTYVSYPEGPLWRSRADGSQRLQLASPEIRIRMPRWSPDGKQIAFTGHVSGQPFQIYVVSAEGGNAEQLVQRNCDDIDLTWSPDGNSLVFGLRPGTSCKVAIYLLDLKSRQVSTIAGSDGLFAPLWSPDGNSIVAIGEGGRLMLFSFATQKWEEAVKGFVQHAEWSRDGRFVYYMNDSDVLRVRIADHKVEKVVSLTRLKFGSGLSLTPDDSPLVLRETAVHELYALDWVAP